MDIKVWAKINRDKIVAWMIGLGFVLFAVHNPAQPLIEYAFLPVVGLVISLMGIILVLSPAGGEKKQIFGGLYYRKPNIDLGSKWFYVPLLIIVVSMAVSGFVNGADLGDKVAPMFFGIYLFGAYLACRKLGKEIFKPFAVAVVVQAVSCVVYGIMYPGFRAGGIIGWTSDVPSGGLYSMAAVFLIFGATVSIFKRRWLLMVVALVGLFFTGAEMAVFAIGVLAIAMIIRRDWSRKLLVPAICLGVLLAIAIPMGVVGKFARPATVYIEAASQAWQAETVEERDILLDKALNNRWTPYKTTIENISPFGYGYNITHFYKGIPHNVPLIIVKQVGPTAAFAWLFLMFFCLIKTRWKYAFVAVLALSVFDHALWTQVAPWCWALVGVASSSALKSDLIFKKG